MDKFNILDKGPVNILHTIFTGEALAYNVVNKWKKFGSNSHIYNAYGPTENTVWSFIYKCNEYTENELINGLVPIGEIKKKQRILSLKETTKFDISLEIGL